MTNFGTTQWNRCRRGLACLLALFILVMHSAVAIAQSIPDIEAPLVEMEIVDVAPADVSQVFTVQAFDDIGLGDVSLHHRRAGDNAFIRSIMTPVGDTGFFSVAVETDPGDLRAFEYYAQALDLNGNRTVTGFAFDPFVRKITQAPGESLTSDTAPEEVPGNTTTDSEAALIAAQTPVPVKQPGSGSGNRRWLYIGLAVLAAGAVASQLGGSGGSSDGSIGEDESPLVPLTVIIGNPIP